LGLPPDTGLDLFEVDSAAPATQTPTPYLAVAFPGNPELQAAREKVVKTRHAVSAARDDFIPDISIFARHTYQDGAPFITHNIGTFGVQLDWNVFDWGKRGAVVGQRRSQLLQAEENIDRTAKRITVETDKAIRKLDQTRKMLDVAKEMRVLNGEYLRLSANQLKAGTLTGAKFAESKAMALQAEVNELQKQLDHLLAETELRRIYGTASHQ
jgi:outer membrane protein TolC